MKIVSLTLAHNTESKIAACLESVAPFVDECIVIDTGITDATLAKASQVCGFKLTIVKFPWVNDFSKARNFALEEAARRGADWAVMIDSDQRIVWNGQPPREFLSKIAENDFVGSPRPLCFKMRYRDAHFTKEQIFQIPVSRAYEGETHEAYPCADGAEWPESHVWETPKTKEEEKEKFDRDLTLLSETVTRDPTNARAWYYLGQTQQILKMWSEARESYAHCREETLLGEEGAWSAYQSAMCAVEVKKWGEALDYCIEGMKFYPSMVELYWYAGWNCLQLGSPKEALRWARVAAGLNETALTRQMNEPRLLFTYRFAHFEGPYNVMKWAYKSMGDAVGEAWAEKQTQEMIKAREAWKP
jgi:tetratricopeptide (TPR) repeat protein